MRDNAHSGTKLGSAIPSLRPARRRDEIVCRVRSRSTPFDLELSAALRTWNYLREECGERKPWHECEEVAVHAAGEARGRGQYRHSPALRLRWATGASLRVDATRAWLRFARADLATRREETRTSRPR